MGTEVDKAPSFLLLPECVDVADELSCVNPAEDVMVSSEREPKTVVLVCEVSSARSAATPKSPRRTVPSSSMSKLAALMSRWMNPLI